MHVRVCPECDEEFRPEIVHCSDCGAMLEDRFEGQDGATVVAAMPGPDAGSHSADSGTEGTYVRILRADRAAELEPLAQQLGKAGLPFQVRTAQLSFELLIREEDHDRVRDALGDLLKASSPAADETPFDPDVGYSVCPACGCRLAPRTEDCTECGLAVGGEEP